MTRLMGLGLGRCSRLIWLGFALAGTSACSTGSTSPPEEAVFQVRACKGSLQAAQGEVFRILLEDSTRIQDAAALLISGRTTIVAGSLRAGDGGFNSPWSWHMDPASVSFPEAAIEVCQGCPSFLGSDSSGQFCPVAEVIARDR